MQLIDNSPWTDAPESTGTTIIACEIKDGVVIGADSRTTMRDFISNRVSRKLTQISDLIYCCRSGASADTQAISDIVRYSVNFHAVEMKQPPKVEIVATTFRQYCYKYRDSLTAGILVAGWDKFKGGQVYILPLGGMILQQKVALSGSGSSYINGFVDATYRENMESDEAVDFIKKALFLAMSRDGSSGGVARVAVIKETGVTHYTFPSSEFRECFYLFASSGRIKTLDELTIIMRSLGLSPTISELAIYLHSKGGSMSFADFLEIMYTHSKKEDLPNEILDAFRVANSKSNQISVKYLRHLLENWGERLTPKEVDRIFREANLLRNQKSINFEDFVKITCTPIPDYY